LPLTPTLTDSPTRRAAALFTGAVPCSEVEDRPGTVRVYLNYCDREQPSTPQLERLRYEVELRASSIVLDLLALALIDRTDVDAILAAGVQALQRGRQMAPLSARASVGGAPAPVELFDAPASGCAGSARTAAQLLVRDAERDLAVCERHFGASESF
jgi:hypothetical protein